MKEKSMIYSMIVVVALIFVITIFQSVQISSLSSDIGETRVREAKSGGGGSGSSGGTSVQEVLQDIKPTGTPDYGEEAGVSYDNVESSLQTLTQYQKTITLSGEEKQRYIEIATTPDTACEYCCGIGDKGFGTSNGRIACGCSHNVAFGGLSKWLIQNTDYSNEEIVNEIKNWKVLFFPKDSVKKEMEKRGENAGSANLDSMVGGC